MQLQCSVLVDPRTSITSKLRQRYSKGILILRHGKINNVNEYELFLTTPQNRNGRLFNITRGSIKRIHSAKMQWGAVTIEMNYPSVLICIKEASVSSLRNFISKLQKILAGEEVILDENKEVRSSDFASLRKRLVINSRKQYNEHKLGFPSYLQELIMSNIGLASVDSRWFGATFLSRLDLSSNKLGRSDAFEIKFLNIVRLRHLKVLILADNEIQHISDDLWKALPKNLLSLDLSNNQISYLSPYCTRFSQMTHLSLSHNRIEKLPRTINNLAKLQCLDISWNRIKFMPSEIKDLSLEMIDVTAYNSDGESQVEDILDQLLQTANPVVKIASLFEYAAAAVLNHRISTTSLPELLRLMIQEAVENCKCRSGGSYKFYPASIVTARYHIEDARSLAFTTVSRNHYRIILQDMEVMLVDSSKITNNSEEQILFDKISQVELLLREVDVCFHHVDGIGKYKKKLKNEIKFLTTLKDLSINELKKYLDTTNITHLRSLFDVAKRYSCCAFYKSFTVSQRKSKREIDLVVDDGATWVKVISRNVRGLAMDFIGASGGANRSVIEQAQDYIEMAQNHLHFFKMPRIIFEFVNGVPDLLQYKLESFGIEVIGDTVNINEFVKLPADFASYDSDDIDDNTGLSFSEHEYLKAEDSVINTINLDISTVFALISSLTHGNGANYNYDSKLLNAQAALERTKPALPQILKVIKDTRLIICRTAYDAAQSIVSTVAGPEERIRANELFKKVEVVDDKLSEKAAKLKLTDKINQRSKIIFGSGDYYKAVTITANRHFVYAAAHQDIHFAVIIHDSRALSEQKQRELRS